MPSQVSQGLIVLREVLLRKVLLIALGVVLLVILRIACLVIHLVAHLVVWRVSSARSHTSRWNLLRHASDAAGLTSTLMQPAEF